ncbi:hypothetical protein TWF281_001548 [Arthrobotrys megalospora]
MSSRVLANALKRQASKLLITYRGLEPESDLQSLAKTPSVAATIVTELQKANVRCTSIGIEALEEIYAEKTYSEVLRCSQSYQLWWTLTAAVVSNPNSLSSFHLNTSKIRQWRSEEALDLWIGYKVYKLWEVLYRHSTVFKDMIDYEEKDFVDFKRASITAQWLWIWMTRLTREGIIERNDVDNLPEVMFRDIIVGSGELAEKLASEPSATGPEQVVPGTLSSGLTETME